MRVVAGGALVVQAASAVAVGSSPGAAAFHVLSGAVGALLIVGLWTPIVAAFVLIDAAWRAVSGPADLGFQLGFYFLLGTIAAALALIGPGAWSIDARLFGMKRLTIPDGESRGGNGPPF
jgi:uncharacterized membrane protein YphA (DoxX/SURF4 family)